MALWMIAIKTNNLENTNWSFIYLFLRIVCMQGLTYPYQGYFMGYLRQLEHMQAKHDGFSINMNRLSETTKCRIFHKKNLFFKNIIYLVVNY